MYFYLRESCYFENQKTESCCMTNWLSRIWNYGKCYLWINPVMLVDGFRLLTVVSILCLNTSLDLWGRFHNDWVKHKIFNFMQEILEPTNSKLLYIFNFTVEMLEMIILNSTLSFATLLQTVVMSTLSTMTVDVILSGWAI